MDRSPSGKRRAARVGPAVVTSAAPPRKAWAASPPRPCPLPPSLPSPPPASRQRVPGACPAPDARPQPQQPQPPQQQQQEELRLARSPRTSRDTWAAGPPAPRVLTGLSSLAPGALLPAAGRVVVVAGTRWSPACGDWGAAAGSAPPRPLQLSPRGPRARAAAALPGESRSARGPPGPGWLLAGWVGGWAPVSPGIRGRLGCSFPRASELRAGVGRQRRAGRARITGRPRERWFPSSELGGAAERAPGAGLQLIQPPTLSFAFCC